MRSRATQAVMRSRAAATCASGGASRLTRVVCGYGRRGDAQIQAQNRGHGWQLHDGVAATLRAGRSIAGAAGSYSISGQDATLRYGRVLSAVAGTCHADRRRCDAHLQGRRGGPDCGSPVVHR